LKASIQTEGYDGGWDGKWEVTIGFLLFNFSLRYIRRAGLPICIQYDQAVDPHDAVVVVFKQYARPRSRLSLLR